MRGVSNAEHVSLTVFKEPSLKACNSWELWREHIELAAGMGLNAYRFSVAWAGRAGRGHRVRRRARAAYVQAHGAAQAGQPVA